MVVACIMENQDDKESRDCQYFLHRGQLQNQEIEIDMIKRTNDKIAILRCWYYISTIVDD